MDGFTRGLALALGMGTVAMTVLAPGAQEQDPRARAFVAAYRPFIDSVTSERGDVVFHLAGKSIEFRGGRMVEAGGESDGADCDPIFYTYSLEPLTEPLPGPRDLPVYCTDVQESLWGRTESEVREHGTSATILGHRMFVNQLLLRPLENVERDILEAAETDSSVARWVDELDVTYSFISRDIAGSDNRSNHSWGLAVDFVPRSYDGKHVYWRWSRVLEGEGWDEIPLEERWSPPERVVSIFESHGFVWGGKWALFDAIHFEYRPEILLYNRMITQGVGRRASR